MKLRQYTRPMAAAAGALVVGLALFTVQQAYAVTLVANASRATVNVAANTVSPPVIGIASFNTPVHLMATQISGGLGGIFRGTAHIDVTAATAPSTMNWSGQNGNGSAAAGNTNAAGTPVMVVALNNSTGQVRTALDPAGNATRFTFQNNSNFPHTFVVTQVW